MVWSCSFINVLLESAHFFNKNENSKSLEKQIVARFYSKSLIEWDEKDLIYFFDGTVGPRIPADLFFSFYLLFLMCVCVCVCCVMCMCDVPIEARGVESPRVWIAGGSELLTWIGPSN